MSRPSVCPECGNELGSYDQTCQKCGKALSYDVDQGAVGCAVCGAQISAYTETCPECGESGYPALRPRKGRKFKGSPALEGHTDAPEEA